MTQAFWHLAVNHIHVIATPMAFLLCAAGVIFKSRDVLHAGFIFLVILGALAYPVMLTGSKAGQMLWNMPEIRHSDIIEHAEVAEGATWGSVALGVAALIGLWLSRKTQSIPAAWSGITTLGALVMSVWMGYAAHLGGLVRHPEAARGYVPAPAVTPSAPPVHTH